MKKTIALLLALLFTVSLLAGCSEKKKTSEQPSSSPKESTQSTPADHSSPDASPSDAPVFPTDGTVSATKEADTVKVSVSLPTKAETLCSLLLLTDLSYQYNWAEGEGRLCDLQELRLDTSGKASATLQMNGATGPVYLVVTTDDGAFTTVTIN